MATSAFAFALPSHLLEYEHAPDPFAHSFSHLAHALERQKHTYFGSVYQKFKQKTAQAMFLLLNMPRSHLRALPGEIKWKRG